MPIMSARRVVLWSAALLLSGCSVTTQLGQQCVLVRKATEQERTTLGVSSVSIKESELLAGQDYISFGALDCDELELTCVRDADHPRQTDPGSEAAKATEALGYCSQACVEGTTSCDTTETDNLAAGLQGRPLTCRSLALDQQALERLRTDDPVTYRKTFGDNTSPNFCATRLSSLPQE
jgi:hypothetical protein